MTHFYFYLFFFFLLIFFSENRLDISYETADDSHKMQKLIFSQKIIQNKKKKKKKIKINKVLSITILL